MALRAHRSPASRVPSTAPRPPWSDVLASLEDGVVLLDASGGVVDVTPAAEPLIGCSAQAALQLPIEQVVAAEPANAWVADLCRRTLADGAIRRRSEGVLRHGRQETPVLASCAPVLAGTGVVSGAVLIIHDLTVQRDLETQTRRAERLATLGPIALGLAHEIRNPLGGIKGAAQLLRAGLSDPDQIRCTEIIVREVERLDGLIEQLRNLSQPPRLTLRPVNIHRVLNDVLALERQAPTWGTVALRAEFDPSLPPVIGDRAQLTQVFLNLVKNALQALGGTGTLQVSTRIEHAYHLRRDHGRGQLLSVLIDDNGPGVPPGDQADLFAPFFTTKHDGSGLGLAVCHRIVTEHGGTIVYEDRLGGGARFRVTLPVSDDDRDTTD